MRDAARAAERRGASRDEPAHSQLSQKTDIGDTVEQAGRARSTLALWLRLCSTWWLW